MRHREYYPFVVNFQFVNAYKQRSASKNHIVIMAAIAPPPRNNNHTNNNPSLGSPSFFAGAPFTQLYTISTVVTFFVARHYNNNNNNNNHNSKQFTFLGGLSSWIKPWTFLTPAELFIGGIWIVYGIRQLEREMSTRRITMWMGWIVTSTMTCHALIAVPYYQALFNHGEIISAQYGIGPYAVMGALFYYFHHYTPRITPNFVSVLGFSFSDKALHYLWFIQAAGGGGNWPSAVMVVMGYIMSAVYDKFLIRVLDVPDTVARMVGTLVSQFITHGSTRTVLPGRPILPPRNGVGGVGGNLAAVPRRQAVPPTPAPPVIPDESAIEQLTMMGFPRARVVEALQMCNNDVQRAADRLLTQS